MKDDRHFLDIAVREAATGLAEGGIPIGACLVRGGEILGAGHNGRVQSGDPTAHGEIAAMRAAGRQRHYGDTVMYTTLMPCYMCAGTIVQFGIPRVVVGEATTFAGAETLLREQGVELEILHDGHCIELMQTFIATFPELWNEDIGA